MNKLYALLAISAAGSCSARNPFDVVFERMKNVEHQIELMFPHKYNPEDIKFTDFSIKNNESCVTLIFKTNAIEKHNVSVEADKGVVHAVIPTKQGQTVITIDTDENGRKYVVVKSKQEIIHEIKDVSGKILSSHHDVLTKSEKHILPTHIDTMHVNVEVSDDSVTLIMAKEESKKIPVTIV